MGVVLARVWRGQAGVISLTEGLKGGRWPQQASTMMFLLCSEERHE